MYPVSRREAYHLQAVRSRCNTLSLMTYRARFQTTVQSTTVKSTTVQRYVIENKDFYGSRSKCGTRESNVALEDAILNLRPKAAQGNENLFSFFAQLYISQLSFAQPSGIRVKSFG